MIKKPIFLGSFVKLVEPDYLSGSVKEALSYGGNALMFFLGSPQRHQTISSKKLKVNAFHQELKKAGIALENVVVHLPYLINLGNCSDWRVFARSVELMEKNLKLCDYLQIRKVVLHPGASLKSDRSVSLQQVVKGLDQLLPNHPQIQICLETMSGKGSELGKTFQELKSIIEQSKYSQQIGVCFDLCHLYSAGYDLVNQLDQIIDQFDRLIGLEKLWVCHINDSKKPFNSHLDAHANIGRGSIGLETVQKFVHHPKLIGKPMILETPYEEKLPVYKAEIAMLRNENR